MGRSASLASPRFYSPRQNPSKLGFCAQLQQNVFARPPSVTEIRTKIGKISEGGAYQAHKGFAAFGKVLELVVTGCGGRQHTGVSRSGVRF